MQREGIPISAQKKFRFGVYMVEPFQGMTWADSVREIEALGYSTLSAPDHMEEGFGPITAMATAAMVTTTLQVGTAVFAADFRHPAVLARELASIDQLSEGRLEVGLGAGYQVRDYRTTGIPMDRAGIRVSRLFEHVAVLRGLFASGSFDFEGEHYEIRGLDGTPAPFREGGPPIFVAGGGPRMLRFAARHADIVGVNRTLPSSEVKDATVFDGVADRIDEKFELIRAEAGERYDDLVFHGNLRNVKVTDDRRAFAETVAAQSGLSLEDELTSPFMLAGTIDQMVEQLHRQRDRWGYTYYTIPDTAVRELAPLLAALA
ncbi:MAG: TIGR03621 family F420-dependent LLM class oxidoreductase [Solirubrobacterales bacterium]